jgi:hypothetical protein
VIINATRILALVCCIVASTASVARASTIPTSALALHPSDLPGFAGVREELPPRVLNATESGEGSAQSTAMLKRDGFRKEVSSLVGSNSIGGALSSASVFSGPRGARAELKRELAQFRGGRHGLSRFAVAGIPGARGVVEGPHGAGGPFEGPGAVVKFRTGRCSIAVIFYSEQGEADDTRALVQAEVIAGASAMYGRLRPLCA